MNLNSLIKSLPENVTPADRELVSRAYQFAEEVHEGQKRASGEAYVQHCLAVASILVGLGAPIPVVVAGLLHDTVEDTPVTLTQLTRDFGPEVAKLVDGVTKLTQLPRVSRTNGKGKDERTSKGELAKETLRKTFLAMGDDVRIVVIKLADRLHNMRTLSHLPAEKRTRIAQETLEIFAPLANRLGGRIGLCQGGGWQVCHGAGQQEAGIKTKCGGGVDLCFHLGVPCCVGWRGSFELVRRDAKPQAAGIQLRRGRAKGQTGLRNALAGEQRFRGEAKK